MDKINTQYKSRFTAIEQRTLMNMLFSPGEIVTSINAFSHCLQLSIGKRGELDSKGEPIPPEAFEAEKDLSTLLGRMFSSMPESAQKVMKESLKNQGIDLEVKEFKS
jgi:hypothetical protein